VRRVEHLHRDTIHEVGALATLLMLAIWGLLVLRVHLVTPAGADVFEMAYVGTLTAMFLILLPLCWKRVRWAHMGSILMVLAMFVGAAKAILENSLLVSWSLYNLVTILAYATALGCAYFSVRSIMEIPSIGRVRTILDACGVILATAVIAAVVWSNRGLIHRTMWRLTLDRIDHRLENLETIDEQIQFLVDEGDLASATVGIVVNDSLVWAQAYGQADVDTVYNIGSITKPFVATAVLQLHERGLIDLDGDVNEHLPFSLRHPDYPDTPITIRMLLTHQSALAHFTDPFRGYHMGEDTADWLSKHRGWHLPRYDPHPPFAEFMEGYLTPGGPYATPHAWRSEEPGTQYGYSTPGYDVLAYIVERVTGQLFAEYARENILVPLGMASTGFSVAEFPSRVATPYERVYGVLSKANAALPLSDARTVGGGGLLSSVPDLAQFMIAHMNQGQAGGVQLLQPETVALMHERAVSFPLGQGDLNQVSYGLGLGHFREIPWSVWGHLYDMHGATGHGGSWWGYQAQMWFVEEKEGGYGIVLLTNTESDFKAEARELWLFASPLRLQVLLMEEASRMYAQTVGG
jgi:CubicO group peptidase (beta-lactamase class C family)